MTKLLQATLIVFIIFISACQTNNNSTGVKTTANSGKRHTRKSLYAKDVQKDLDDLQRALAIMRKMDCDSTNSWYYQGAIHWVPDSIPKNPYCLSYHTYKDLKTAWDNCTHTPEEKEQIHFLVWHRMYIYHFEKIVRKLSGDSTFSLPYWGYTDTVNKVQSRTMPAMFRDAGASLFEQARLDSINKGFPITGAMEHKLSLTKLFANTTYAGFNKNIDAAPHGAMHNYLGYGNDPKGKSMFSPIKQTMDAGGLMQDVTTAAFDPIFWVHHANIDRIWQQWTNSPNGKKVTIEELKSAPWVYTFFDENGKKVVYKPEEIMKIIYTMDYNYDDTQVYEKTGLLASDSKTIDIATPQQQSIILSQKPGVVISKRETNFKVQNNLAKALLFTKDNTKPLFMKVTVSFDKAPKGSYEVYLNLPANTAPSVEDKYFAGFMTFFGAGHHMAMNKMAAMRGQKSFSFEITGQADALKRPEFNISVLKYGGLPQEEIKVETVTVFRQ
jgi:hypothetical protein